MASYSAHHLFLFALAFMAAAEIADAWDGGPMFFSKGSKATRPEAVDLDKVAAVAPAAEVDDPSKSVPEFSRPSSGGVNNRGYGLYGRPEESYPEDYFRRGVHHNAEKLTTTSAAATPEHEEEDEAFRAAPSFPADGSGRGQPMPYTGLRGQAFPEDGSGRGRPMPYTGLGGQAFPEDGSGRGRPMLYTGLRGQAFPEDGSGRGRPMSYGRMHGEQRQQQHYGMSDTRLYQNGRYYNDVGTGKYNPVRTTRSEEFGSGQGERSGGRRYGAVAGQEYASGNYQEFGSGYNAGELAGRRYGNGAAGYDDAKGTDRFGGNGLEKQNEQYIP